MKIGTTEYDDYGQYIEIKRVFDVVEFEYFEDIFSKGGIIELIKKFEKENNKDVTTETTLMQNLNQFWNLGSQIKAEIRKLSPLISNNMMILKI